LRELVNFRDMGGVKTSDGREVKRRRLLRSGELVGLSNEVKKELYDVYSLRCIVDLRGEGEVLDRPDDKIEDVRYLNIQLHEKSERRAVAPEEKEFRKLKEASAVVEFMTGIYERMITNPFSLRGFSGFVKAALDNTEGALLFHCYAGKDRTGVAAAILYTLLGVSKNDIYEDYLMTNILRKEKNDEILARARADGNDEARLAALKTSYEVCGEYLERVYEIASEKSGSFLRYIMEHMYVSDAEIDRLRENYLV